MAKLVEKRTYKGVYDFDQTEAIVDHPKLGRILIRQGYGGVDQIIGGAIRWIHGDAYKLHPGDTLEKLDGPSNYKREWGDPITIYEQIMDQDDNSRPFCSLWGRPLELVAELVGL